MKIRFTALALCCVAIISCSSFLSGDLNKNKDSLNIFFGGFDGEKVTVEIDSLTFDFKPISNFSLGVDTKNFIECDNGLILIVRDNAVSDSGYIATCREIPFLIEKGGVTLDTIFASSAGQFVIIDYWGNKLKFTMQQSTKPFVLE